MFLLAIVFRSTRKVFSEIIIILKGPYDFWKNENFALRAPRGQARRFVGIGLIKNVSEWQLSARFQNRKKVYITPPY